MTILIGWTRRKKGESGLSLLPVLTDVEMTTLEIVGLKGATVILRDWECVRG